MVESNMVEFKDAQHDRQRAVNLGIAAQCDLFVLQVKYRGVDPAQLVLEDRPRDSRPLGQSKVAILADDLLVF